MWSQVEKTGKRPLYPQVVGETGRKNSPSENRGTNTEQLTDKKVRSREARGSKEGSGTKERHPHV